MATGRRRGLVAFGIFGGLLRLSGCRAAPTPGMGNGPRVAAAGDSEVGSLRRACTPPAFRSRLTILIVVLGCLLAYLVPASAADATNYIPTQFIAKVFTEALGRAPTTTEWNTWTSWFGTNACGATNLESTSGLAYTTYTSAEFTNDYGGASPSSTQMQARVVALVRGLFSSDVNATTKSAYMDPYVNGTNSWTTTVSNILTDGAFSSALVGSVCNSNGTSVNYGFPYFRPLDLDGSSHTASSLQTSLNNAASTCGTVSLSQTEVIRVGGSNVQDIVVPPCVTLTTTGSPGPTTYALMGRIVPDGKVCRAYWCAHEPIVQLGKGAQLKDVWVDGQGLDPSQVQMADVETDNSAGSDGTVISNNRFTDPDRGGTAVRLDGWGTTGVACGATTAPSVSGNLITGYANAHSLDSMAGGKWASGIDDMCEHATVSSNTLVDMSDRGITIGGERYRKNYPATTSSATVGVGTTSAQITVGSTQGMVAGRTIVLGATDPNQPLHFESVNVISVNSGTNVTIGLPSPGTRYMHVNASITLAFDEQSIPATQHSTVSSNTIISAGTSAFAALAADPMGECLPDVTNISDAFNSVQPMKCLDLPDKAETAASPPTYNNDYRDFTGSSVDSNVFWTGSNTFFFDAMMIGDYTMWGKAGPGGTGFSFTNNTVGVTGTQVNIGIDTNNAANVYLHANTTSGSSYTLVDGNPGVSDSKCPQQVWGTWVFGATFRTGSDIPPVVKAWSDCMVPDPPSGGMDQIKVAASPHQTTLVGTNSGVTFRPWGANAGTPVTSHVSLSAALSTGGSTTMLSINPAFMSIPDGHTLQIVSGTHKQNFVVSNGGKAVSVGATSIPVVAQVANFAYPIGAPMTDWTANITNLRTLQKEGINLVRPLVTFNDIIGPPDCPTPCTFPDGQPITDNLTILSNYVDLAAEYGIYVDITGLFDPEPPTNSRTTITGGSSSAVTINVDNAAAPYSPLLPGGSLVVDPGRTTQETVNITSVTDQHNVTVVPSGSAFLHTHGAATLSAALVNGTAYNNTTNPLPVVATTYSIDDGAPIVITSGAQHQTFTVSNGGSPVAVGSTAIKVVPLAANFAYPATSTVTSPYEVRSTTRSPAWYEGLAENNGDLGDVTLSGALTSGTTYSTTNPLPVSSTIYPIADGSILKLSSGTNAQTFTISNGGNPVPLGSTAIKVVSQPANFGYPTSSTLNVGDVHGRWQAQAQFWSSVANQLKAKTNVLAYGLMNEPGALAPGTWTPGCNTIAPACYTQALSQNNNGRTVTAIAKSWIATMIDAIRTSGSDPAHLITENSGFSGNGFDPSVVGPQTSLDYLSLHDYPGSTPSSTATTCASDGVATLSSALVNGATYNNTTNKIPVRATTTYLPNKSTITIASGSNPQTFTINNGGADLPPGSTAIPVTDPFGRPMTANFSYPTTSTVVDSAGCDAALAGAHTFQVGKPLIIEEVYDQGNANEQQMTQFLTGTSPDATGWAGFGDLCSPLEVSNPPGSCGDILQFNMIFTKIWLSAMDTDKLPLSNALP